MAQILSGGNAAVQALLYGNVHPGTQRFFENRDDSGLSRLRESAQTFAREAIDKFGFMSTERTKRLVRDVRRSVEWAWHGDYVRPLRTLDDLQLASPTMRRYVMAEPTLRRRYHQQQLSGYDDGYVDVHRTRCGEDHVDYQRVMQDIVVVDDEPDENDNEQAFAHHWMIDVGEDDETPLEFEEQEDILQTWALAKKYILQGKEDPTSLYNATLD